MLILQNLTSWKGHMIQLLRYLNRLGCGTYRHHTQRLTLLWSFLRTRKIAIVVHFRTSHLISTALIKQGIQETLTWDRFNTTRSICLNQERFQCIVLMTSHLFVKTWAWSWSPQIHHTTHLLFKVNHKVDHCLLSCRLRWMLKGLSFQLFDLCLGNDPRSWTFPLSYFHLEHRVRKWDRGLDRRKPCVPYYTGSNCDLFLLKGNFFTSSTLYVSHLRCVCWRGGRACLICTIISSSAGL